MCVYIRLSLAPWSSWSWQQWQRPCRSVTGIAGGTAGGAVRRWKEAEDGMNKERCIFVSLYKNERKKCCIHIIMPPLLLTFFAWCKSLCSCSTWSLSDVLIVLLGLLEVLRERFQLSIECILRERWTCQDCTLL